jgi:hypothetical protein
MCVFRETPAEHPKDNKGQTCNAMRGKCGLQSLLARLLYSVLLRVQAALWIEQMVVQHRFNPACFGKTSDHLGAYTPHLGSCPAAD